MDHDVKSLVTESHLTLKSPVHAAPYRETRDNSEVMSESFILRPWIGMSDSREFVIGTETVLTIGAMRKDIREQYELYIEHSIEIKRRLDQADEIDEAMDKLLRSVAPGEPKFITRDEDVEHGNQKSKGRYEDDPYC